MMNQDQHFDNMPMPLSGHVDPAQFHSAPGHEEALARMHFLVEQRLRLGVLLGESGSGKSMLLAKFSDDMNDNHVAIARLSLLGMGTEEFLQALSEALHFGSSSAMSKAVLWRKIADGLRAQGYQQKTTVLLLDDADEAIPEVHTAICRICELDATADARLTIILAAQAKRLGALPARLLDRAALRIDVERWDREDTLEYLTYAVEQMRQLNAGCEAPEEVFSATAIDALHELSGGLPRRISQLAQWSLLAGAGLGLEHVDDETVTTAAKELGVAVAGL